MSGKVTEQQISSRTFLHPLRLPEEKLQRLLIGNSTPTSSHGLPAMKPSAFETHLPLASWASERAVYFPTPSSGWMNVHAPPFSPSPCSISLPPSLAALLFNTSLPFSFLPLTAKHCLKPRWVKTEVFLLHQGQWERWREIRRPISAQPRGGDLRWGERNGTKGETVWREREREGGLTWLQITPFLRMT